MRARSPSSYFQRYTDMSHQWAKEYKDKEQQWTQNSSSNTNNNNRWVLDYELVFGKFLRFFLGLTVADVHASRS